MPVTVTEKWESREQAAGAQPSVDLRVLVLGISVRRLLEVASAFRKRAITRLNHWLAYHYYDNLRDQVNESGCMEDLSNNRTKQCANARRQGHRERAPEGHAGGRLRDGGASATLDCGSGGLSHDGGRNCQAEWQRSPLYQALNCLLM